MKQLVLIAPFLIAACATEPEALDESEQQIVFPPEEELEQLVLQYCGMHRDGVTTYDGLTGTYQRMGLTAVDEPVRMKLIAPPAGQGHANGTFTATFKTATGVTPHAGRFTALVDNPAIGAALALDTTAEGEYDKLYFVLAIRRSFGQVRGLCLAGAEHPFLMQRTYF